MGREAHRLHLPVKTQCFIQLGISCELGKRKEWDGDKQDRRHLLLKRQCAVQFGIRSAAGRVMFPQQGWTKYSNPATLTVLNPRTPKSQCFSARVTTSGVIGVWFLSSIGANALQVTLTLNFGGEGLVPDRRGLNMSSIYGSSSWPASTPTHLQYLVAALLLISYWDRWDTQESQEPTSTDRSPESINPQKQYGFCPHTSVALFCWPLLIHCTIFQVRIQLTPPTGSTLGMMYLSVQSGETIQI